MTPMQAARAVFQQSGVGQVMVGFSGGKDSCAVLDLAVSVFGASNVHAYFMYLVKGLDCEMSPLRRVLKRYPGVTFHEVVHWEKSRLLKHSICRPYVIGNENIRIIKQRDVEAFLRAQTGIQFFAGGQKTIDGILRNAMMKKTRNDTGDVLGLDVKFKRLSPLASWSHKDVISYLRAKKIPIPIPLGPPGRKSNGVSLHPEWLAWCEEHHEKDFIRICEEFPYAREQVCKWRWFGEEQAAKKRGGTRAKGGARAHQVSEVRPDAHVASGHQER